MPFLMFFKFDVSEQSKLVGKKKEIDWRKEMKVSFFKKEEKKSNMWNYTLIQC